MDGEHSKDIMTRLRSAKRESISESNNSDILWWTAHYVYDVEALIKEIERLKDGSSDHS